MISPFWRKCSAERSRAWQPEHWPALKRWRRARWQWPAALLRWWGWVIRTPKTRTWGRVARDAEFVLWKLVSNSWEAGWVGWNLKINMVKVLIFILRLKHRVRGCSWKTWTHTQSPTGWNYPNIHSRTYLHGGNTGTRKSRWNWSSTQNEKRKQTNDVQINGLKYTEKHI